MVKCYSNLESWFYTKTFLEASLYRFMEVQPWLYQVKSVKGVLKGFCFKEKFTQDEGTDNLTFDSKFRNDIN